MAFDYEKAFKEASKKVNNRNKYEYVPRTAIEAANPAASKAYHNYFLKKNYDSLYNEMEQDRNSLNKYVGNNTSGAYKNYSKDDFLSEIDTYQGTYDRYRKNLGDYRLMGKALGYEDADDTELNAWLDSVGTSLSRDRGLANIDYYSLAGKEALLRGLSACSAKDTYYNPNTLSGMTNNTISLRDWYDTGLAYLNSHKDEFGADWQDLYDYYKSGYDAAGGIISNYEIQSDYLSQFENKEAYDNYMHVKSAYPDATPSELLDAWYEADQTNNETEAAGLIQYITKNVTEDDFNSWYNEKHKGSTHVYNTFMNTKWGNSIPDYEIARNVDFENYKSVSEEIDKRKDDYNLVTGLYSSIVEDPELAKGEIETLKSLQNKTYDGTSEGIQEFLDDVKRYAPAYYEYWLKGISEDDFIGGDTIFAEADRFKHTVIPGVIANLHISSSGVDFTKEYQNDSRDFADKEYMDKEQRAKYLYLLDNYGKEEADAFKYTIQDSINKTKGEKTGEIVQITDEFIPVANEIFNLFAGAKSFFVNNARSMGRDIGTTASEHATQYIIDDLLKNGSEFERYANLSTNAIGNQIPSMVISFAVGTATGGLGFGAGVANTVGNIAGTVTMANSARGAAYKEARDMGFDRTKAGNYAAAIAVAEGVTSSVLSGISRIGGNVVKKLGAPVIGKLTSSMGAFNNAIVKTIANYTFDAASEGFEEGLQAILEPMLQNTILGTDNDVSLNDPEVLESALLGAISAMVLNLPGTVSSAKGAVATEQAKKRIDTTMYNTSTDIGRENLSYEINRVKELVTSKTIDKSSTLAQKASVLESKLKKGRNIGDSEISTFLLEMDNTVVSGNSAIMDSKYAQYKAEDVKESHYGVSFNDVPTLIAMGESMKKDGTFTKADETLFGGEATFESTFDELKKAYEDNTMKPEQAKELYDMLYDAQGVTSDKDAWSKERFGVPETEKVKVDGTNVKADGINPDTGKVTLTDGSEADIENVTFSNQNEAQVYTTAAEMGGVKGDLYASIYNGTSDVKTYDLLFNGIYHDGRYLNNPDFEKTWNDYKEHAEGIMSEGAARMIFEAAVDQKSTERNNAINQAMNPGAKPKGKVSGTMKNKNVDTFVRAVAAKFGADIVITNQFEGNKNASFDPANGKIYVRSDSKQITKDLVHEMMEAVIAYHTGAAFEIQDVVISFLKETKGTEFVEDWLEKYRTVYEKEEGSKTTAEAKGELVNDHVGVLFSTEEGMKEFCDWILDTDSITDTKKKDIIQALKKMLDNVVDFFKRFLNYAKGNEVLTVAAETDYETAKAIRKLVLDAFDKVSQTLAEGNVESEAETSKGKVKNSIEVNDEAYMDAVNRGDMETAQKMVDEAAKNAGYTNLLYHGSKNGGGFTEFRDWGYFTENKVYAERYMQRDNPKSLYSAYVRMNNAFDTRKESDRILFNNIRQEYGLGELQDTDLPDWTDGYDIADYIDENNLEYDSIILDEGGDLVEGKPISRGLSYVVRKSNQIKSADPVTYDDNGNVIPLSERFDKSKTDIRNSIEVTDENANNLSTRKFETQEKITARYKRTVDKILEGKYQSKDSVLMGYTPEIFIKLGMPSLPFVFGPGHIYTSTVTEAEAKADKLNRYNPKAHYHGLGTNVVKNLYSAIQDPLMIIASKDTTNKKTAPRSRHSVVAIIDVGNSSEHLLMPVEITAERRVDGVSINVNALSSSYMRDVEGLVQEAIALTNIGDVGVFYMKKEATNLLRGRVSFPKRLTDLVASSDGIIHQFSEKINMQIDDVTKSLQFVRWFGDWQNKPQKASKVVNRDGSPRIVYHYTNNKITTFDLSRGGSNQGQTHGDGIYLSTSPDEFSYAGKYKMELYANIRNPFEMQLSNKQAKYILETYASKKYDLDKFDGLYRNHAMSKLTSPVSVFDYLKEYAEFNDIKVSDILKDLGYDGVHDGTEWVAFDKNQVKSAKENVGIYDTRKNNIHYSLEVTDRTVTQSMLEKLDESIIDSKEQKDALKEYKERNAQILKNNELLKKARAEKRRLEKLYKDDSSAKAEIDALNEKIKKLAATNNRQYRRLAELESTKAIRDLVRQSTKQAVIEQRQKDSERLVSYREKNKAKDIREKIKKLKNDLQKAALKPTDNVYIPGELLESIISVCELIDDNSPLYKKDGSINKTQQARELTHQKLLELADDYKKLEANPDPLLKEEYDPFIKEFLDELRKNYDGKSLAEMGSEELKGLYDILRAICETLSDARKTIGMADSASIHEYADSIVEEQAGMKKKKLKAPEMFSADNTLSTVRDIERITNYNPNSMLYKLFLALEAGEREKNFFVMNAYKNFESLVKGKENQKLYEDAINKGFMTIIDSAGNSFKVSKMQMMQSILSYEREIANGLNHIKVGGFTFADLNYLSKGYIGQAVSADHSHTVRNTVELVERFKEALAEDEWAQSYMQAARKFFNDTAKNAINKVFMKLKHRILAKEKNYIPFEVDKNFVVREISSMNDVQETINSYGILKNVNKAAPQPLIISGLNNVIDRHIQQVGMIYGQALNIRDFNKIWNTQSNNQSVRGAIEGIWGAKTTKVIEQAIKDLQGPRSNHNSQFYKNLRSNMISATFTLNLSVVLKQTGSLYAARSMINYRTAPQMWGNLVYTIANYKKIAAEVDKYTASAWNRRQGLSSQEIHTLLNEATKTKFGRVISKIPVAAQIYKYSPKLITAMDSAVALSLWKYCKADVKKATGLTGDALLHETAKFYDSVIENTQSMNDVLHRPEIQKGNDLTSDILGLYKTDLYQLSGELRTSFGRWNADKTAENANALGKAVYATLSSIASNVLITAFFSLARYKVNPFRDEEDDEFTLESWWQYNWWTIAGEGASYLFPTIGGELANAAARFITHDQTYDTDFMDSTPINFIIDLIDTGAKLSDLWNAEEKDIKKIRDQSIDILCDLAHGFGIPAENVRRAVKAAILHMEDISNGEFLSFNAGSDPTNKQLFTRAMNKYLEGDEKGMKDALTDLEERVTGKLNEDYYNLPEDEFAEKLNEGMRNKLKTAFRDTYRKSDIETQKNIRAFLEASGLYNDENGELDEDLLEKDIASLEGDGSEGPIDWYTTNEGKLDKFEELVDAQDLDGAKAHIESMLKDKDKSSLKSSFTSRYKPLYLDAHAQENTKAINRIKKLMLNSTVYGDNDEIVDTFKEWRKDELTEQYKDSYIEGDDKERKRIRQIFIDSGLYKNFKEVDKKLERWLKN